MNIIIVGGGKEVYFLTKSFISKGYNVTIVNNNEDYCKKLARTLDATVVFGDGTKSYVLEDAGIAYGNMVIALTPRDPDNLIICQIAQKKYNISKTFAIVNDPNNISIFRDLGVDTVISTANIISSLIEQRVSMDDIVNLIPIEDGKVSIMELEMPDDSPAIGKTLSEIKIHQDAIIGCIIRGGNAVIPRGNTMIVQDDRLVILYLPIAQADVLRVLRGRVD